MALWSLDRRTLAFSKYFKSKFSDGYFDMTTDSGQCTEIQPLPVQGNRL
jgi:hypothetical protein